MAGVREVVVVNSDSEDELRPVRKQRRVEGDTKGNDPLAVRVPLDAQHPERDWIALGLPASLRLSQREALVTLMAVIPKEHGQVKVHGKVHDVPRFQQSFLRDYTYSHMPHKAEKDLPPIVEEALQWANAVSTLWHPDDSDQSVPRLFNQAIINRYVNGHHHVGSHRDDPRSLHLRSPLPGILSAPRGSSDFVARRRTPLSRT